jgi:hypothetical protein
MGTEEMREPLKATISDAFDRYGEHITRIEVKFSDEIVIEIVKMIKMCACAKGLQPLVVTDITDTVECGS